MEMTIRNWKRTESEKENMAKEAVLISSPRNVMMHWSEALLPLPLVLGGGMVLDVQGMVWSESETPFSRASCSRVMGINEPI